MTKITKSTKESLVKGGYIAKKVSKDGKLALFNYTQKTVYEKKWNEHTICARGHVFEIKTGKLIARPFPKFFNFGEHTKKQQTHFLNHSKFTAYEKMDGSLGIIYHYGGKWQVNTRGSFNSPQAQKAKEMLETYDMDKVPTHLTLLVEIVYPENRIVVNYGEKTSLFLLAVNTLTDEYSCAQTMSVSKKTGMPLPKVYSFSSVQEIINTKSKLSSNEEGFVIKLGGENIGGGGIGGISTHFPRRIKIKSIEYLKLAKILSGLNPKTFLNFMVDGKIPMKILQNIPEEMVDLKKEAEDLQTKYSDLKNMFLDNYDGLMRGVKTERRDEKAIKKQFAAKLMGTKSIPAGHRRAYFLLLINKPIDQTIIKILKNTL